MSHLREAGGFGAIGEIDCDIGEDGIAAASFAIDPHSNLEILPAAVPAGRRPALTFFCGVSDPTGTAPSPDKDRWSPFAPRPGRQRPAVDRLTAPSSPHDVERTHQGSKPFIVIGAEKFEIRPRRAATDAEAQAVSRQCLNRLHAMGKLDRVAQRYLQHRDAELDPLGHGGYRR